MTLAFRAYLDAIGEEVARSLDIARLIPEADVPSCPGWDVRALTEHLIGVYGYWISQLVAADTTGSVVAPTLLHTADPVSALEDEATVLLETLETSGESAPCWNWSDRDYTSLWVARRMGMESAIHRVDFELASGRSQPVPRDLAVDGLFEKFEVHLRLDIFANPTATLGGSVCLICSDAEHAWIVGIERGQLRLRYGRGPADVALVGSASDLFQFVWNRKGLAAFDVTGNREVAAAWRLLPC